MEQAVRRRRARGVLAVRRAGTQREEPSVRVRPRAPRDAGPRRAEGRFARAQGQGLRGRAWSRWSNRRSRLRDRRQAIRQDPPERTGRPHDRAAARPLPPSGRTACRPRPRADRRRRPTRTGRSCTPRPKPRARRRANLRAVGGEGRAFACAGPGPAPCEAGRDFLTEASAGEAPGSTQEIVHWDAPSADIRPVGGHVAPRIPRQAGHGPFSARCRIGGRDPRR